MPTIPFRGLGTKGILRDVHAYDLPLSAWSGGSNVRFDNSKAMRSPVFRKVFSPLPASPAFCATLRPSTGYDQVIIGAQDGRLYRYVSGGLEDVSADTLTPATSGEPFTSAYLGDVLYLNRPTHAPRFYGPNSTKFAPLPAWDASWRCRSLRQFKDYLVALNVRKGAVENPTMVKTSDATLAGAPPQSWDHTDTTKQATENILAELDGPLLDGCSLKGAFVLYSRNQVWLMEFVGGTFIFEYRRAFTDGGLINTNCAVEVQGLNYCFGPTDIYRHDGIQKQSIATQRVRDYIFRNLKVQENDKFFVHHMPKSTEIVFAYVSGDDEAFFDAPTACNKAAVYNYGNDTWGFIDLPNVAAMTLANVDAVLNYEMAEEKALTYDLIGGTYYDQQNSFVQHSVAVTQPLASAGIFEPRILGYDPRDKGSLAFNMDTETSAPAFLERLYIDLDEAGSDLTTYKVVKRIWPQVSTFRNVPLQIQVGGAPTPSGPIKWGAKVSFDPVKQYKVDTRTGGRYLCFRLYADEPMDFEVSGFDADVVSAGRR